jgi:hypothetical protein
MPRLAVTLLACGLLLDTTPTLAQSIDNAGAAGGPYEISWCTIENGGTISATGGDFEIAASNGQIEAHATATSGGAYEFDGGYWPGVPSASAPPVDALFADGFE